MSALSIQVPYQIFADSDGTPLDNGYVWIGTTNLDPRTNPVNVYFDAALTQVAPNPLRTVNGYVYNAGSPSQLYIDGVNFSIRVEDKKSVLVYSFPDGSGISPNANGIVYTPAGTGAVATTVQGKLRESVSVLDFYANGTSGVPVDPTGVVDSTAGIQAAILAVYTTGGGIVFLPPGTYKCSAKINMYPKVILRGSGSSSNGLTGSVLKFSHAGTTGYTGDGLLMVSPINTSTSVNTSVENLTLLNTNASNIGAGYDDVGGTFVNLNNVSIFGFKYGVVFDQTELATIRMCNFSQQITAGVWLVNGSSHTAGASIVYTNRINISECQFNESATCYGIVDDGGYAHTFQDNNYNGCLTWIRLAGASSVNVIGGEFENNSAAGIYMSNLTLGGGSVGSCVNTAFIGTMMLSGSSGLNIIQNVSTGTMTLLNNWFTGSTTAISMTGGCSLRSLGNVGATYSGIPSNSFQDDITGTFTPVLTFATPGDLSVTYANQVGTYQRIGNVVHFSLLIFTSSFTKTTASGALQITGLPFAGRSTSNLTQAFACRYQGITKAGYTQFTPSVDYGQTFIIVSGSGSGVALSGVTAADVPSGGTVYFQITGSYHV